ncbi:MAG: histidine phosphatase family protein [Prevotella sp.]|uniref:histidine phosphatase family protein n=1 Tax=Prevotella sp. TaxID=59823 RepID=UPI002A297D1E|nr:histidine phosphatase family protein [Prevotella sp.]MDD7317447.1 histidine phosphatase family protein [Prevotellaceae bacterium]MDY4019217.1 histidine phosphatase family protein [Prevotella sp.]
MTTLLLARHGETFDNEKQIMQGQTQGRLNPRGTQQAQLLADSMNDRHIDAFIASDLNRAVETCRIVAERHGMEVVTTSLLRERDWGAFTGRYIPDIKDEPFPDDVEPLGDMLERAQHFLDFIAGQYQGKTVLAVGHGIINKAIQAQHHHKQMKDIQRMNNAEIRTLLLP